MKFYRFLSPQFLTILLLGFFCSCELKEDPQNLAVDDDPVKAPSAAEPPSAPPPPEPEPNKVSDLVYRDGLYYNKDNEAPLAGKFEAKYDDGSAMSESHYVDGKKDGVEKSWDPDGTLRLEAHYKNGKRHGVTSNWHPNGQKMSETHYANGKIHGVSKTWHNNGQLSTAASYNFGKNEGFYRSWYSNGQKMAEIHYRNNQKHGMEIRWDEEGKLKSHGRYEDGAQVEVIYEAPPADLTAATQPTEEPVTEIETPPPAEEPKPNKMVSFVAKGDVQVVAKDSATQKVVLSKSFKEGEIVELDVSRKVDLLIQNGQNLTVSRNGVVTETGVAGGISRMQLSLREDGTVDLSTTSQ